jgi:hypothetical protein
LICGESETPPLFLGNFRFGSIKGEPEDFVAGADAAASVGAVLVCAKALSAVPRSNDNVSTATALRIEIPPNNELK